MAPIFSTAVVSPAEGKIDRIEQLLLAHAEYVRANEPGTLNYQILRGKDRASGSPTIVIWEVYKDEAADEAHSNNAAFSKLLETLKTEALVLAPATVIVSSSAGGISSLNL